MYHTDASLADTKQRLTQIAKAVDTLELRAHDLSLQKMASELGKLSFQINSLRMDLTKQAAQEN